MSVADDTSFDNLTGWTNVGTAVISSAQSIESGNSLLIDATGSAKYISKSITGSQCTVRFYYRIETAANASASIFQITATNTWTIQARPGRLLRTFTNVAGTDSAALNLNQWYRIDVTVDTSVNPGVIDYQIDGVDQVGQSRAVTAVAQTLVQIGNTATNTYKMYFDKYTRATTNAEYPLGEAFPTPDPTLASGTGAANTAGPAFGIPATAAAGTGAAADTTISSGKSVTAELSSGTGTAPNAPLNVAPNSLLNIGQGTGAAASATTSGKPTPTVAAGTGAAANMSETIAAPIGSAASTGSAVNPAVTVGSSAAAGVATGTGAAANTTTVTVTTADPEAATATGTAPQPVASLSVPMGSAAGTGAAIAPSVGAVKLVDAVAAAGTGAATNSGGTISASITTATAVGAAGAAVVATDDSTSPEIATGTGAALLAGPSLLVGPLAATGTGTAAFGISGALYLGSAQAAATGTVYTPNVGVPVNAAASVAAGTGAAGQVTPYVTPRSEAALGTETLTSIVSDTFTRSVSSGLGTADSGQAWAVAGTASAYNVTGSAATLAHTASNQSRRAWLSSVLLHDLDQTFRWQAPATGGSDHHVFIRVRQTVSVDGDALMAKVLVSSGTAAMTLSIVRRAISVETELASIVLAATFEASTNYTVRMRVMGQGVFAKLWKSSTSEPGAWQLQATDTQLSAAGAVGMATYSPPTGTYPLSFTWDDLSTSEIRSSQAYNAAPAQQAITNAIASAATGTGLANDMITTINTLVPVAAGTGASYGIITITDTQLEAISASGAAYDGVITVSETIPSSAGTGAAAGITTAMALIMEVNEGFSVAYDATITAHPFVSVSADQAFSGGAAANPMVSFNGSPSAAAATAAATNTTSKVSSGQTVAEGVGAAINALIALVDDGVATPLTAHGVGVALNFSGSNIIFTSEASSGTGAVNEVGATLGMTTGHASGTGAAGSTISASSPAPSAATATGTVEAPLMLISPSVELAGGVGQAIEPGAGLDKQVATQPALGTGAGLDTGTLTSTSVNVFLAEGAGVAYLPITVRPILGEYGQARQGGWPVSQT